MESSAFDRAVRSIGNDVSRRRLLRSFGAAFAGIGVTALLGAGSSDAARRKKGKRKSKSKKRNVNANPQAVCPVGQQVGTVNVPANGTSVFTPVLKQGQRYRLRATGFWLSNATHGQDAFADFELANPNASVTSFNGIRLGLAVDGGSADFWGTYNPNHTYERIVTGQGAAIQLRCSDAVFSDNSGQVQVQVLCA
jgi:hypothetical protein